MILTILVVVPQPAHIEEVDKVLSLSAPFGDVRFDLSHAD